ncbi:MAG: NADH-quinone oxidoreductase subunit NuoG [Solirubrobacteraceae bacterium]
MPRPEQRTITFTIDGREVQAPENSMLVDAAKHGDVEIPVFCYEPKLGQPVGACRMCLVEIEGMPKLQTGCSTPVKDGMVVSTQSPRVKQAQEGVVEFLLVNHPLDCPVCDKGGECPLQDISFGWGKGTSRVVEPKRHFVKPLALSEKIAIDRERCILCYRCVRFSQEVAEDSLLVLLERGADSYVGTFDGNDYEAPFSGNIIELCPVGALTSQPYRFKARPWDIEGSGSVCTLCPSQCNITFTVRDDRVLRVLARDHSEVDDGWLCDRGRFGYQRAIHSPERIVAPMVRDGGELRPVSWERALEEAAAGLRRAGARSPAIVGGESSSEEGFLLARLLREGLGSQAIDTTAGIDPGELARLTADPALQATVPDLEHAHAVLVLGTDPKRDMPIVDLRIRKGVRRKGVQLAIATSHPSALDDKAELSVRYAQGADAAFAGALATALYGGDFEQAARDAGAEPEQVGALARLLSTGSTEGASDASTDEPREVVILYGERAIVGGGGADALLKLAAGLNLASRDGAGLLGVPAAGTNGRGLFEAGVAPGHGAGGTSIAGVDDAPSAERIAELVGDGQLPALYVLNADPLAGGTPDPAADLAATNGTASGHTGQDIAQWRRALASASMVIAHASFLTEGIREHANVVFPAESYAEKEGTIVHPDGRIQRLRPAIGRPGEVRAGWSVLADLARRLDLDLGVLSGPMATAQLFEAVPFYSGLTLEEIGGRGVRWQERQDSGASASAREELTSDATAGSAAQ